MFDVGAAQAAVTRTMSLGGRRNIQRKEASDVDDLVADFGFLAVNATARDFHGFTKEMSFARLVLSTSSVEEMPRFSSTALPPRDLGRGLVQRCLQEMFTLYPVLTDTAIFGSLDAVYQQRGYTTASQRWDVRLTFAIALMSRSRSKGDLEYQDAIRHASSALEDAEAVLLPGSIASLRAILLLVLYSLLDPTHFNSWYLIGVASRVMADLGLHQDPGEELRVKISHLMLRRRIFYCVYTLDRAISLAYVRAFSFSDDSANVAVVPNPAAHPSFVGWNENPAEDLSSTSGTSAAQLLKLRQIQSIWFQQAFQSSREDLIEPWQNRSSAINAMQSWARALSNSTPIPLKHLFLSEIFFSNILVLSPPQNAGLLCSYGKAVLFDNAVRYSEVTLRMCDASHNYNHCTNLDILRSRWVGEALLNILADSPTAIYNTLDPPPPPLSAGSVAPPILRRRGFTETIDEAVKTISRIDQILNALETRFGNPLHYSTFKTESASTVKRLYSKRQHHYSPDMLQANELAFNRPQYEHAIGGVVPDWYHVSIARSYESL
ncbi:hypothetical protein MMC26_007634 [Xylographa opegraphella]|nr:hypothetical protein [Xylographa opegraphella]